MIMKKIISIFCFLLISIQFFSQTIPSNTENYVFSTTYLNESKSEKLETIKYIDGLGRTKQIINVKATNSGKDIVVPIEYDNLGKQLKNYLPLPINSLNGTIQPIDSSSVNSYYNTLYGNVSNAYSEVVLNDSPLNRLMQSAFPGDDWKKNAHSIKYDYDTNVSADGVKKFTASFNWADNIIYSSFSVSTYPNFQLYKTIIKNEDNHETHIFKNKLGQNILIRKINVDPDGSTQNIDTYYVYNKYNQIVFIIPPLASAKSVLTPNDINQLCYQYRYDSRGRIAEKKLPGKGFNPANSQWIWDSMVYDKQDRLIAVQDANLKLQGNKWLYTQYDQFSRVVATGICNAYGLTRKDEQTYADSKGSNNTIRSSNMVINYSGMDVYYSITAYPSYSAITELLSLNYYDTYPSGAPSITSPVQGQEILTEQSTSSIISTKSLPTASFVKNIGENKWTKNYVWYDTKGRAIASNSINHLGGFTKTESELDFVGMPKKVITKNSRANANIPTVTIEENFTYDNQKRLKKHEHEVIGKSPKETLAEYIYNDLGQVIVKKIGGSVTPIQKVNYSYNIRGWLTGINDLDSLNINNQGDLFAYKIRYNDKIGLDYPNTNFPTYKVKPRYNGNIAEVDWISLGAPGQVAPAAPNAERYGYVYDSLDRLKAGFYQNPSSRSFKDNHEIIEEYDLNGNIKKLKRTGRKIKNYPAVTIDNLEYHYSGNLLDYIVDNPMGTPNPAGYEGGGALIEYDSNGNMTKMPDKGISGISYNFLDLPTVVNQNGNVTNYTYRADGTKLKRAFTLNNTAGSFTTSTEYLDGFHYITTPLIAMGLVLKESDDNTMYAKTAGEEETFRDS